MNSRWVDIHIKAKSDLSLDTIKSFIADDWNDFADDDKYMEIHKVTVKVGRRGDEKG